MNLAVLCSPESWYLRDLQRAAGREHRVTALPFSRLSAGLSAGRLAVSSAARQLDEFDAVLVRTMPPGSLEQVVFRMDVLARLEARGVVVVNRARAIEATVDKFLALAQLQAAGLTVPGTFVCQHADDAQQAFDELGRDVVVKPLFGGEGRGICRVSDPELAARTFKTLSQLNCAVYLQEYIEHEGFDIRLFVLGSRVWAMRRRAGSDWRTNVSCGATTEPCAVDHRLEQIAVAAARAVGASMAGIDLLPGRDGRQYVLEVNGVPGWRALARTLEVDFGKLVLDYLAFLLRSGKEQ